MLNRTLTIETARVTEAAAIAASAMRGRGDERAAHERAVQAMHLALNKLSMSGRIVIGEGDAQSAAHLYHGEVLGDGGAQMDIAVAPLEGDTLTAKDMPGALSVAALAERDSLLSVPGCYMDKIAIGGDYPDGLVDLDLPPAENLNRLAEAKGVPVEEITVCILDRPRHARLIDEVREAGAAVRLITDGDIAGVIHVTDPEETGIDIYMGSGGAPEGVLAAAALSCIGGQMQTRLVVRSREDAAAIERAGIEDPARKFTLEDMVKGDVIFAATGVTDGSMLRGVRVRPGYVSTNTVSMRAKSGTVRWSRARRRIGGKSPAELAAHGGTLS